MVHAQLHMWDGHSLPPCAPPHCGHPFQHSLILWTFSQCCWAAVTGYWFNFPHIMVHNQVKSEHFNMMTTDEMLKLIARNASSKGSFPADLWQHTSQIVFPPPSLHLQYCRERTPTPHLQLRLPPSSIPPIIPPKSVQRGKSMSCLAACRRALTAVLPWGRPQRGNKEDAEGKDGPRGCPVCWGAMTDQPWINWTSRTHCLPILY